MKRLLALTGLLALIVSCYALPEDPVVQFTGDKQDDRLKGKVCLCHVPEIEVDSLGNVISDPPHLIIVDDNAVRAHLQNHGDCIVALTDSTRAGTPCDPTDTDGDGNCDIVLPPR